MPTPNAATESSSLLKPADPIPPREEDEEQLPVWDPDWTRGAIRTTALVTTFFVLYAFADLLKYVSTIRLLELGVCREYYLEHDPGLVDANGNIPESLCKLPEIQQHLAHLRGYMSALESIIGLLLTVPYGLLVNRLGECFLAGLDVLGYLLSCAWLLAVFFYWTTFPTWTAVLSPFFRVVGGGAPFLASLMYSITARHVPDANRSLCFFIFLAAQTITSTVAVLFTASILDHGFLFMPLLLNLPAGLLCMVTLVAIWATDSPKSAGNDEREQDAEYLGLMNSIKRSMQALFEALNDRNVILLLATVPVSKTVNPIGELTWQYIPKRFDTSLAAASRVLTIPSIECLILLLLVFPTLKSWAQARSSATPTQVDLYFVEYGFLVQMFGCIIMASSQSLVFFVFGVLVFTLGCGIRPALQAVLANLVSRDHVAVLFTAVAFADAFGSAAGSLLFNWLFGMALAWYNDSYLGLPFVIGALGFLTAFVASVYVGSRALQLRQEA